MLNISEVIDMKNMLAGVFVLVICAGSLTDPHVLPMRERAQLNNQILEDKLQKLLPSLLHREGIDM